ncbi:uncharacterized protein LOC112160608 [Oryzias melastigma]|uniref:uncharacterized protein LOC112160608 n=1 Tax=Oryzias melastigma TaxID=30732 RepID=UPI00168CE18F|nr:uncharacterized protein LOC112160608 [Oryzias melastigma]
MHDVDQAGSESKFIQRKSYQPPDEMTKQQEDLQKLIDQIHSLSSGNTRSFSIPSTEENPNYDEILSQLSALNSPLRERFMEDFPKMFVCILSGRQDCGLEAELIKTASLEFGPPLLSFLSSLRSQTCTSETSNEALRGLFGTYATIPDLSSFEQIILKILSSLSVSGSLKSIMNALLDATARYVLQFMAIVVEVPMEYIRIALQFGIEIPSFDKKQTCSQGDLKQLIMWGMKNNVSWSFSAPFIEILLENIFPLEQSTVSYPGSECQDPTSVQFQRTTSDQTNDTAINHEIMCDQSNLTSLNETLCADVLSGAGDESSASILTLCQVLSNLSHNQVELTWRNMCYFLQALVSPFSTRSSVCSAEDSVPFSVITSLHEFLPVTPAPRRVARGASSLRQLVCDYSGWLANTTVDAGLVSLCSDNDHAEFVRQVCNNATLMKKLLSYPMNSWLYGYCGNSSADVGYLVSQLCVYEQWLNQPTEPVDPALINFCVSYDSVRLTQLMCEHTGFLMLIMSNPDNGRFMPNCTNLPPPPPISSLDPLSLDSCQYSEWHDLSQITTDILSKCIMFDQTGFTMEVCLNKTFLNSLLQIKDNAWLEMHCSTSFIPSTPDPNPAFNFANWCDYQTWGQKQVDSSIVALCWQHDPQSFNDNVCCQRSVLEKLLQDSQNTWLSSACSDTSEITLTPQVCTYSEWTRPVIVDMTDVALCSEIDPDNFTSKVCNNVTVLQNLLANQDNIWLIEYCGNHSNLAKTPVPGVGQGTGGTPFNATKQCQYSSWSVTPPHAALLVQCWEHDLSNFVSSICSNAAVLLSLSWEPSSMWVNNMCQTFTNYTTAPNNSSTAEKPVCIAKELIKEFNLVCPSFYISDCQPCTTQNKVLQMMVRCLKANLRTRETELMTPSVAKMLNEAVSTTIVILLTLEDALGTTWHVGEAIRPSLLRAVVDFFKNESDPEKKTVLLQCFGVGTTFLFFSVQVMFDNSSPVGNQSCKSSFSLT